MGSGDARPQQSQPPASEDTGEARVEGRAAPSTQEPGKPPASRVTGGQPQPGSRSSRLPGSVLRSRQTLKLPGQTEPRWDPSETRTQLPVQAWDPTPELHPSTRPQDPPPVPDPRTHPCTRPQDPPPVPDPRTHPQYPTSVLHPCTRPQDSTLVPNLSTPPQYPTPEPNPQYPTSVLHPSTRPQDPPLVPNLSTPPQYPTPVSDP